MLQKLPNSFFLLALTLVMTSMTCKVKQDQANQQAAPGQTQEKRVMPETLPPPTPEDLAKQEVSIQLMEELANHLAQQKDMSEYAALVSRMQGKNLFSNAANQGYRILALSNTALQKLPERERQMLTDATGAHLAYQMKFFIYHVCPEPHNPYVGYAYRTLSGQNLNFKKDSLEMPDMKRTVAFKKDAQVGSKLHVFRLSGPLFY